MSDVDDVVGSYEHIKTLSYHEPSTFSRQNVMAWVSAGIPQRAMARLLMIDHGTLMRHYAYELEHGTDLANGMVVGTLFQKAIMGDVASLIFWLKVRLRWKEPKESDVLVIDNRQTQIDARTLARELRNAVMEQRETPLLDAP